MNPIVKEYKCFADWVIDGKTMCHAGGIYQVRPATGEDEEGYCDVINCDDGSAIQTECVTLAEYMEPVEPAK